MNVNRKILCRAVCAAVLAAGLLSGPASVDAASARGSASATVLTPSVISIASVSIVLPSPNMVSSSGTAGSSASTSTPSVSALSTASGGPAGTASDVMTIAGVQVTPIDGGSALSFSMGGDTTSSYVLQLSSALAQGVGAGPGPGTSGSSLIVSPPALSGNGRLAVVLSQAPSDLARDAVSLTVNFN